MVFWDREKALEEKMARIGINRNDVREIFIRSSGPGGQNVNKTSTCVYLKHLPTGIEVKCQKERTQAANRIMAWNILAAKIQAQQAAIQAKQKQRSEKIKRQNRQRPRSLKEKILRYKKLHSQKKQSRSKVRDLE